MMLLQWKVWNFFPEITAKIFFLKIGILSAKVYIYKIIPNIEVCYLTLTLLTTQSNKVVIVMAYYLLFCKNLI